MTLTLCLSWCCCKPIVLEFSTHVDLEACKLQPSAARRLRMANAMVVDSDRLDGRGHVGEGQRITGCLEEMEVLHGCS